MTVQRITVAVVQAEAGGDLASSLARTAAAVADAKDAGATLVVFPETWVPGYPAWLDVCRDAALWDHPPVKAAYRAMAEASVTVPGPADTAFAKLAREHGVTLVVGVSERVEAGPGRGTLYNSLLRTGISP
jgi:predicted amidohydrolase